MSRPLLRPLLRNRVLLCLAPVLLVGGCFKSLDESLMDQTGGSAGSSSGGGSGGTGATGGTGGTGATGGTSGTGATGGTSGTGGDSGTDAGGIVAYDASKYPVTNIGSSTPPVVIAVDDTTIFRVTKNKVDSAIVTQPLAGGAGKSLPTTERPQSLAAPVGQTNLFIAAGQNTGSAGSVLRMAKDGSATDPIVPAQAIELAVGIAVGSDDYVYVSTTAQTAGATGLMRFPIASTAGEDLYTSQAGGETGGDVAVAGSCVYWISNGNVWVITTTGGARSNALTGAITDAVGLATDATHLYYTRADGSVWRRVLSTAACDGAGTPETQLASGFEGVGDLVTYDGLVAWTATGDTSANYSGGGVFSMPVSGGTITQIAPSELGPSDIDQGPNEIVYATDAGAVRKVPKTPQ